MDTADWEGLADDVLDEMETGTYSVTRRRTARIEKGRARPDPQPETLPIVASVQVSGRELLRLPEERRTIESKTVFTRTRLLAGGRDSGHEADVIAIDGQLYEVQLVENWRGHVRAIAQLMVTT